ncbi:recombinase family protein [Streptomyces sp. NRRL F-5135]|uniref:recombinase family protein n=1 Tax=Streptomyces sp. NRRL F-5135 TaxID=1463858 RepID=UPI000B0CB720|nr:recombinase family protein [Streptomyces sp. NRRL F-5135]
MKLAREIRSSGLAVTLVVHKHKRLGRGIELAMLAEELKASGVGLEFLTGELKGSHDPSGIVFTVLAAMSGMEREYSLTLPQKERPGRRHRTQSDCRTGHHAHANSRAQCDEQKRSQPATRPTGRIWEKIFSQSPSETAPHQSTPMV